MLLVSLFVFGCLEFLQEPTPIITSAPSATPTLAHTVFPTRPPVATRLPTIRAATPTSIVTPTLTPTTVPLDLSAFGWLYPRYNLENTGTTPLTGEMSSAPVEKWRFDLTKSLFASFAAGDVDGDGKLEVVVVTFEGDVIVLASLFFAWQGADMHHQVGEEEDMFHALQNAYFSQSKATRDSAPANSALTNQLVEIQNYPSTLLELKLVGIGRILTGIFIVLLGILMALVMMPMRMSQLMQQK
ncbi:MAG: FG-GAP repeat protein [Candidatus Micrarchaeia archaeon]